MRRSGSGVQGTGNHQVTTEGSLPYRVLYAGLCYNTRHWLLFVVACARHTSYSAGERGGWCVFKARTGGTSKHSRG